MTTKTPPDKLLSVQDAADIKRVTKQAVHRAILDGRLRAVRVGNCYVIRPADLAEYEPDTNRSCCR